MLPSPSRSDICSISVVLPWSLKPCTNIYHMPPPVEDPFTHKYIKHIPLPFNESIVFGMTSLHSLGQPFLGYPLAARCLMPGTWATNSIAMATKLQVEVVVEVCYRSFLTITTNLHVLEGNIRAGLGQSGEGSKVGKDRGH